MLKYLIFVFLTLGSAIVTAESTVMTLKGVDDKQHALTDYIGKDQWVVVNVWSTACKFCRHELPDLVDFHEAHKDNDAMILGIAIDLETFGYPDEATVKNFVQDYFIDYPNLFASADQAAAMLGSPITSIPMSFFFNPQGEKIGHWNGIITLKELETIISMDRSKKGTLGSGEKSRRQPHKE